MMSSKRVALYSAIALIAANIALYTAQTPIGCYPKSDGDITSQMAGPLQEVGPYLSEAPPKMSRYTSKTFDLTKVKGISKSQLDQHQTLYKGYVKKRNEIHHGLTTVDRANSANITYSPFRALKVAETFALNGSILHELYFSNLGTGTKPGPQTKALIKENWGSIDAFKDDLLQSASCSRGWVVTAFQIDDGKVYNYVLDAHNETVPVLALPILVVDVYEHAYMIDFGINRAEYLDALWKNINWDVVEHRIKEWVNKFHTYQ